MNVIENLAGAGDVGSGLEVEGAVVITESWESDTVYMLETAFVVG